MFDFNFKNSLFFLFLFLMKKYMCFSKRQCKNLEDQYFLTLQQEYFMLYHRNFTYWIDKRKWKYVFLLKTLELSNR